MRWRHAGDPPPSAGIGGQAILTLRALIQSGRFGPAWERLSGTDRREVTIPGHVAPFPCKRAALMDRFQTCHPLAVQDGEEARAAHDGAAG